MMRVCGFCSTELPEGTNCIESDLEGQPKKHICVTCVQNFAKALPTLSEGVTYLKRVTLLNVEKNDEPKNIA